MRPPPPQTEVALCFKTDGEMLQDIEAAAELREKVTSILSRASKVLQHVTKANSKGSASHGASEASEADTPKI